MALQPLTEQQTRTWTRAQWWFENVYRGDVGIMNAIVNTVLWPGSRRLIYPCRAAARRQAAGRSETGDLVSLPLWGPRQAPALQPGFRTLAGVDPAN